MSFFEFIDFLDVPGSPLMSLNDVSCTIKIYKLPKIYPILTPFFHRVPKSRKIRCASESRVGLSGSNAWRKRRGTRDQPKTLMISRPLSVCFIFSKIYFKHDEQFMDISFETFWVFVIIWFWWLWAPEHGEDGVGEAKVVFDLSSSFW